MEFTYRLTERNLPALEFITSIGEQYRNEAGTFLDYSRGNAWQSVKYDPDEKAPIGAEVQEPVGARRPAPARRSAFGVAGRSSACSGLGRVCTTSSELAKAIEEYRVRQATARCRVRT